MKLASLLLLAGGLAVTAETTEELNQRFPAQSGGKLVVEVDFGSIEVNTHGTQEVVVHVLRKVTRSSKADEEAFLRERPVTFSKEGDTLVIRSRAPGKSSVRWWSGRQRTEGQYVITVPASFRAELGTAGGGIAVSDLSGEVRAHTSGGGLKFARLHGPLNGGTSGGGIRVSDCEGVQKVNTSGGGIEVSGGSGSFQGGTSGGSVSVRNFSGPVRVETSGGGIHIENVVGRVSGSTSGGSISAQFTSTPLEDVKLETSGGGVTVRMDGSSAFDLDAATSGGGVSSDLPVVHAGKPARDHIKGSVNGGGKPVVLRSSGGSIRVQRL